jgi:biopolymer transport protein TolR
MGSEKPIVAVSELNVTPMLDVLLVLLIIFMAASIRVHLTMDGELPIACAAACGRTNSIVLEVLPGPAYRVNKAPVAREALREKLLSIYAARPEKIIQLAGYPGTTYQDVVSAMDIARSAGVRVIGIAPKDTYLPR